MMCFLGDYAQVVNNLSEEALRLLICIFEGCFTMDSALGIFFDIENFVESVGWADWKTEDVISLCYKNAS